MGLFGRKPEPVAIKRSKYFPEKFFGSRSITLDDSVEYFVRKSLIKLPTVPLFVEDIKEWNLDQDVFEEILFEDGKYKLIYDVTNDVYYFMQKEHSGYDLETAASDVVIYDGHTYNKWSGAMDIIAKNEVLSIFNREISKEADEYLMVELKSDRGTFTETWWIGVLVQPGMIK